jgi:hypothetical protein
MLSTMHSASNTNSGATAQRVDKRRPVQARLRQDKKGGTLTAENNCF